MIATDDETGAPFLATIGVAALLNLQLITELEVRLGFDPDGSRTVGRALGRLNEYGALSRALRAPGMPWDDAALPARNVWRGQLLMAEPIMARLAQRGR